MSYLPCKNPACKSNGIAHPNCKCWGGMAEGGEAKPFCSTARDHEEGCQYFAGGGLSIPEGFEPDDTPQEAPQAATAAAPAPTQAPGPSGIPEGFEPEQQGSGIPEGFEPEDSTEPAPSSHEPGYSLPSSIPDAAHRLATNGLFADPPEERPAEGNDFVGPPSAMRKISDTEIHKTAEDYEKAAMVGSLITGVGGVAAATEVANAASNFAKLGRAGSLMIKGGIANGLIQSEDEVSKYLMGTGDPNEAVGAKLARVAGSTGLGVLTFGTAGIIGNTAEKLVASKLGGKLSSYVAGIASALQNPAADREASDAAMKALHESGSLPSGTSMKAFKLGQKAVDNWLLKLPTGMAETIGGIVGGGIHGAGGAGLGIGLGKALGGPISEMLDPLVRPSLRKVLVPTALKVISSGNTQGMLEALGHAADVSAGYGAVMKGIEPIFNAAARVGLKEAGAKSGEETRKQWDDWIGKGGVNHDVQQEIYNQNTPSVPSYAEGGEVKAQKEPKAQSIHQEESGVAIHYPEQNILMHAAKGRISNYLSALRPQDHQPKLAFDDEPDNSQQKKSYHKALDLAAKPLGILEDIQHGTLAPEDVKHFNALHPELNGLLQRKLTEKIVQSQIDGKKPPYRVRQALSLFMGVTLSSDLTPQNIQAAQAVFAKKEAPQKQGGEKAPAKKQSLSKSDQAFMTADQARQKRANKI